MKYILFLLLVILAQNTLGQRRVYKVGDVAFCGIVFFVEEDTMGNQRGLVCAPLDQHVGIRWYKDSFITTFAHLDHPYAKNNSDMIIRAQGTDDYAATVCRKYRPADTLCTNWYLPTRIELILMYSNIANSKDAAIRAKGKFKREGYWSSLELKPDSTTGFTPNQRNAFIVDFFNGRNFPVNKANKYRVRAVREFQNPRRG